MAHRGCFSLLLVWCLAGCQGKPPSAGPQTTPAGVASTVGGRQIDRGSFKGDEADKRKPPEMLNAGNDKLNIALAADEVVLTSKAGSHGFENVTYVLTLEGDAYFTRQFTSSAVLDDFLVRVKFSALANGVYNVKVYGKDQEAPMGEGAFRLVDGGI